MSPTPACTFHRLERTHLQSIFHFTTQHCTALHHSGHTTTLHHIAFIAQHFTPTIQKHSTSPYSQHSTSLPTIQSTARHHNHSTALHFPPFSAQHFTLPQHLKHHSEFGAKSFTSPFGAPFSIQSTALHPTIRSTALHFDFNTQ